MAVNDYDKYAAKRHDELKNGLKRPHRFVEKPAMESILPDLTSKRILLLGCGSGDETILLEKYGAKNMIGIDISEQSILLARESYPNYDFKVADMHNLPFEDKVFDFVYSSLAIHYAKDIGNVLKEICRVLRPGGVVQFSVAHPMRWASERLIIDGRQSKVLGYTEGEDDGDVRLYGSYSDFKDYTEVFPSGESLKFWVGPPSMYFSLLKENGFQMDEFIETRAIEETKDYDRKYYERYNNFPQFTVFQATKS